MAEQARCDARFNMKRRRGQRLNPPAPLVGAKKPPPLVSRKAPKPTPPASKTKPPPVVAEDKSVDEKGEVQPNVTRHRAPSFVPGTVKDKRGG